MIQKLNNQMSIYLSSYFMYNFARVLPHAILTVLLLNKGLTVSQIALVQSFFMIAGLIFEFPLGILTDIWSAKRIYQLSLVLLIISYSIIWFGTTVSLLCVAWFIYGMSNAAISGSLETYFLKSYENNTNQIKHFNVNFNYTTLYSALIGGGIGSFLYSVMGNSIYSISIGLIIISLLMITFFFKEDKISQIDNKNIDFRFGLKLLIGNSSLIINIIQMALYQIIAQIFFQFWQVIFLHQSFDSKYFGAFYILFQLLAIMSNYIFNRISKKNTHLIYICTIAIFLTASILVHSSIIFILLFCMFLIPFNLYSNQLFVDIEKNTPPNILSSVVSFSGTLGSIVSMITLWTIGILNHIMIFNTVCYVMIAIFTISSIMLLFVKKIVS